MLPDAFTDKTITTPTPCVIWTGALNSKGYPCFAVDGVSKLAHRLAYEDTYGPILDGLTVDHLCRVKRCVNPDHLEAVTRRENAVRAAEQDRPTECPKGHLYTPENTIAKRRGDGTAMACRECQREWTRANNRKRQPKPGECGTYSNYTRGCRCDDCKEANRIYRREYYARRKAS